MLTATERRSRIKLGNDIMKALDGRTQTWLAEKIDMPRDYLSNKLRGRHQTFDQHELNLINAILNTSFEAVKSMQTDK